VVEQKVPHGVGAFAIRIEVVFDDEPTGNDEIDRFGRLLEAAAVEEEQVERCALRKMIAPIAREQLDVREATETVRRDRHPVRIELDRHERSRSRRQSRRALAERSSDFGTTLAGGQHGEQAPYFWQRGASPGHKR
jgi:hypothetical protein